MRELIQLFSKAEPQFFIVLFVLGLFTFAYVTSPQDETLRGALIAAFSAAWGYYLGSSNGAKAANNRADRAIEAVTQVSENKK